MAKQSPASAPNIFSPSSGRKDTAGLNLEMATVCHQRGLLDQAEQLYQAVLATQPLNYAALQMLATLRLQRGDASSAAKLFEKALSVDAQRPIAWNNYGVALKHMNRLEDAFAAHDNAVRLAPDYLEAISNRCAVLGDLQRLEEALADSAVVLSARSDVPEFHNNRGVILQDMRRFEEALACFGRAISLRPDYADAHWNEARCRLLMGDYERGWVKYEWRWKRPDFSSAQRTFAQPLWLGENDLSGQTILLHAEQGLGDTLQLVRYVPKVASLRARVLLEVQPQLKSLLRNMLGTAEVYGAGEVLPDFDYHCPLMSLPLAFNTNLTTVPAGIPYVQADPHRVSAWATKLQAKQTGESAGCLRVGLMWSGNANQKDNHLRSLSLRDMLVFADDRVKLYSLQKDLNEEEQRIAASSAVEHFGESLEETAALIANLDLVISVCTSAAHLAGAMGKPVWILLHRGHDWRWLHEREDSPWYPSARIFRQSSAGDWSGVLSRAAAALKAQLGG